MKKISKESIQHFMLMHAEKLVLGACLAATGAFVLMSVGAGEKPLDKSPSDLVKVVDSAKQRINSSTWDDLKPFREGKSSAEEQIANATPVDASKFSFTLIGTPVATLAPRNDPEIFKPEQLMAHRFTVGVMINSSYASPLEKLVAAPNDGSGARGNGSGARDDGSGSKDDGSGSKTAALALERSGVVSEVNRKTMTGLRPVELEISPEQNITTVLDMVAVTAVVDFKKQSAEFEKAFAESVAYNAKRDRPVYQFVEVQRREVSEQETKWRDISEFVTYAIPQSNPLRSAPFQLAGSAPEVVAPENYDPVLTQSIPAFAMLDYQDIATHPALQKRREFPSLVTQSGRQELPLGGDEEVFPFGSDLRDQEGSGRKDVKDASNSLRKGTDTTLYQEAIAMQKAGAQYRLVRFFDQLAAKKRSSDFEYRVRVWVGDPNQVDPVDGFRKHRGQRLDGKDGELNFFGDGVVMDEMIKNMGTEEDDVTPDVAQDVKKSMLSPPVRKRIAAAYPPINNDTDVEMMEKVQVLLDAQSGDSVKPFHVAEISETGQLEQIELPPSSKRYAYIQYLRFARPSPWSDPVLVKKKVPTADVYAGKSVHNKRTDEQAEPHLKMVVSYWDKYLGAKIPTERNVFVGETMNFNAPAYLTHPISWEVLVAEVPGDRGRENNIVPFDTNVTIVDAIFGEKQELPNIKRQSAETSTEVLLMDGNGILKVTNQFEDATDYRNEITMPDDSRFFGKARKPKKSKKDNDDEFSSDFDG